MTVQPCMEVVLEQGGDTLVLRASLRAAVAIETMPGGIAGAYEGLLVQSLTTIRAVILATAADRQEAQRFLAAAADKPLSSFVSDAQAACLAVLAALICNDGDDSAAQAPSHGSTSGETMTLREYFKTLYQYATGWLGWSPAEVWNASPAEIETAFAAHVDRLVKMTPGASSTSSETTPEARASTPYNAERLREIEEQGFDPAFDRHGLRKLKAMN